MLVIFLIAMTNIPNKEIKGKNWFGLVIWEGPVTWLRYLVDQETERVHLEALDCAPQGLLHSDSLAAAKPQCPQVPQPSPKGATSQEPTVQTHEHVGTVHIYVFRFLNKCLHLFCPNQCIPGWLTEFNNIIPKAVKSDMPSTLPDHIGVFIWSCLLLHFICVWGC